MLRTRVEGAREYSRRLPTAAASLAFETAVAVRECVCTLRASSLEGYGRLWKVMEGECVCTLRASSLVDFPIEKLGASGLVPLLSLRPMPPPISCASGLSSLLPYP